MDKDPSAKLSEISHYFLDTTVIQEIDHMDDELFYMYVQSLENYDFSGILVMENVMGISFGSFANLYPPCKEIIEKTEKLSDDQFQEKVEDINLATRIILCLNGEINSAFNRRHRMLQLGMIPILEEELHFLDLINLKFKKSSVAWHYRKKVLKQYIDMYKGDRPELLKILDIENAFLDKFLKKYPRNYYGWSYKNYLIEEIIIANKYSDVLYQEYLKQKQFCEKNVHDYSAFHLLQHMFTLLNEKADVKDEIPWIIDVIQRFEQMYSLERQDPSNLHVKIYELEAAKKYLKFLEKQLK